MDRPIRSFVMRPGRITRGQQRALDALWSDYCLPLSGGPIDFKRLFPQCTKTVVEIGFGMGEASALIAQQAPSTGFLGIEVFRAGIGKLLSEIERSCLANLRILPCDAVEVVEARIAPGCLDGIHVFFPDPWPKKRHHKRRLLQPPVVKLLAERLRAGGYLYVVTDWEEYADEILQGLSADHRLENPHGGFSAPQPWRPETKFERKGREAGRAIREIYVTKV